MVPTFKLSRKSLHWRLATVYGSLKYDRNGYSVNNAEFTTDICTYVRAIMYGLLIIAVILFCSTLIVIWPVGDAIGWLVASIHARQMLPMSEVMKVLMSFVAASVGGITVLGLSYLFKRYMNNRRLKKLELESMEKPESKPGIIGAVVERFKNKTCVSIGFDK